MFGRKSKQNKLTEMQQREQQAKLARQEGALKKPDHSLGTTGVPTQPITEKLDHEVYARLHNGYPALLNDSIKHPVLNQKIKKLVTSGDDFKNLPTYGRPVIAKEVLIDVSGLGPLQRLFILNPHITDAGYDGYHLWYKTNDDVYRYGDQPGEDPKLFDWQTDGGRHRISMLLHKFCYNDQNDSSLNPTHPMFDGEYNFGGPHDPSLRVSAIDATLTPLGSGPTFSVRMSVPYLALRKENFKYNSPMFIYDILNVLIKSHANILISGITGSGKTELQKMMIGFVQPKEKNIMIEDTPETHLHEIYPDKDILDWTTNPQASLAQLVAESLRNDGDWVHVAETRGAEAYQMFQSVKTGHHITTTLHASSNVAVPSRFAGMCEDDPSINVEEKILMRDFVAFMNIGIHTDSKVIGGHTFRFIDNISEFIPYIYYTHQYVTMRDKNGQPLIGDDGKPVRKYIRVVHHTNGTHTLFKQELHDDHGVCKRHWMTYKPTHYIQDLVKRNIDQPFDMPYDSDGKKDHVMTVPKPKPGE